MYKIFLKKFPNGSDIPPSDDSDVFEKCWSPLLDLFKERDPKKNYENLDICPN